MKTVIVFDHPYTSTASENISHNRSFLAAVCKQVIKQLESDQQQVNLINLHADHFNPVMSAEDLSNWRFGKPINKQIAEYQKLLLDADQIIFMFPIWWEVMPAMTKGFLDKVYAKGILYKSENMHTNLKQPKIKIITTMSTPKLIYRIILGTPLAKALFRGTFLKTRLYHFKWINLANVEKLSLEKRQNLLKNFKV